MWSSCQKYIKSLGQEGLPLRIKNYKINQLTSSVASRALQIVAKYRHDDVATVSTGAGAFYSWVRIHSFHLIIFTLKNIEDLILLCYLLIFGSCLELYTFTV